MYVLKWEISFRIEGIKKDGCSSKDFKTIKEKDQVTESFKSFVAGSPAAVVRNL